MKTIEDIKADLLVEFLNDSFENYSSSCIASKIMPFINFLKAKEIKEFICNFGPEYAYYYARQFGPCKLSREIACKDPRVACNYALFVDRRDYSSTREAANKDGYAKSLYVGYFGKAKTKRKAKKCQKDIQDKKI
jgi:hypothetical protein